MSGDSPSLMIIKVVLIEHSPQHRAPVTSPQDLTQGKKYGRHQRAALTSTVFVATLIFDLPKPAEPMKNKISLLRNFSAADIMEPLLHLFAASLHPLAHRLGRTMSLPGCSASPTFSSPRTRPF